MHRQMCETEVGRGVVQVTAWISHKPRMSEVSKRRGLVGCGMPILGLPMGSTCVPIRATVVTAIGRAATFSQRSSCVLLGECLAETAAEVEKERNEAVIFGPLNSATDISSSRLMRSFW